MTPPPLNVLVSYPYIDQGVVDLVAAHPYHLRFLLDCGAFTAWAGGNPIRLNDYCQFIESLPFKPWRYFALDVIGDPKQTLKNYHTMLERGLRPLPIMTTGEELSVMDHYYETSDVVGVGGLNGLYGKRNGHVRAIMNHANGRRVHLLGFTVLNFIKHYRPYMCDSSSWESAARFAQVPLYIGNGEVVTLKKAEFRKRPKPKIWRAIAALGVDPGDLSKVSGWAGGKSQARILAARSAVALSLDIEKNLQTKQFIASATRQALGHVCNAHKWIIESNGNI